MSRDPKEYLSKDRHMRPIGVAAVVARADAVGPVSAAAVVVPNLTLLTEVMSSAAVGTKRPKAKRSPSPR